MTKSLSRKSNGYGSSFAEVLIKIKKPLERILIDENWQVHSSSMNEVTFKYTCKNYYSGDDETIVQNLWRDLPEGIDPNQVSIDWTNSVY